MAGERRETVFSDIAELVDQGITRQDGPVADRDVTRQGSIVGHDDVVAQVAVVGDVHAGHDPVVVADDRLAAALRRAAAEGAQFADGVVVADHQFGILTGIFFVLRFLPDRGELVDPVVPADGGAARDHDVRTDPAAGPDGDVGTDDAEWPDLHVIPQPGSGIDQSLLVNAFHISAPHT